MKYIYVLDESNNVANSLIKVMENEKNVKIKKYNVEQFEKALGNIPDIVVINEDNLNVDIHTIFKMIKANEDNSITPIIVISSNIEEKHIIDILKNDVEVYLQSQVNEQILYYTIINIMKLLNRNRMVSPLTGLPGNVQIQAEMKKRLANKEKYAMIYIDLDNFKAYNDTYGFSNGDDHIGGDDFVAIVEGEDYEQICQNIIAEFDACVQKYFTKDDVERGYIEVENRRGIMEQFPLTTISVGVVEVTNTRFKNTLEIGEAGATVKHLAKTIFGSTYVIDRRKNRDEIFDKADRKKIIIGQ